MNGWWVVSLAVALSAAIPAFGGDLSLNGFGSVYYSQSLKEELRPAAFRDAHPNFTSFSLMGLNIAASVEDQLDFAAQLVALGTPVGSTAGYGLIAQWAHATYRLNDDFSLRVGRQLHPVLLASEYVRIGYLLPFRQVPASVFNISPFTRFDGLSLRQALETDAGTLTLGIFGGKPLLDVNDSELVGLEFSFENLLGAELTLEGDGWRVHAQAARFFSRLVTSAPLAVSDRFGTERTYSAGFRFDRKNIVSWGEYIFAHTPKGVDLGTGRYAHQGRGSYWLIGYRFGKWLPRYTFAKAKQNYNVTANGSVTSHTLGVNYQTGQRSVVKIEYQRDFIPAPQQGGYFITQPAGATATSGGSIYAGLDFIF